LPPIVVVASGEPVVSRASEPAVVSGGSLVGCCAAAGEAKITAISDTIPDGMRQVAFPIVPRMRHLPIRLSKFHSRPPPRQQKPSRVATFLLPYSGSLFRLSSGKESLVQRLLIDDVITPAYVKIFANDEMCRVLCQEGSRNTDVVDTDQGCAPAPYVIGARGFIPRHLPVHG
jgi:hypothetical protein